MKSAKIQGGSSYFTDLFQTFFPVFVIVMLLFCVVALLMLLYLLLIYVVKCKEKTAGSTFHFSIEQFWQRIRFWSERINFKLILVIFYKILCGSWNSLTWITQNKSAYCNQICWLNHLVTFIYFIVASSDPIKQRTLLSNMVQRYGARYFKHMILNLKKNIT